MLACNLRYKIKSKTGWVDFSGVSKDFQPTLIEIITSKNKILKCTPLHKLQTTDSVFMPVIELSVGDSIYTKDGFETILYKEYIEPEITYDAVDAGVDHCYYTNDILSHNTEFIGSSNTLIAPAVLLNLVKEDALYNTSQISIHEEPVKDKPYVIICDVARGVDGDYSAFTVIDISAIPYRIVAKFKDNKISPMLFPDFIYQFAKKYNDAFVLVEINDAGQQVADILHYDLEYENMVHAAMKGRKGQQVGGGFGGQTNLGVRTTKQVKRIGCQNLKTLVEAHQLILNDTDVIEELYSFVQTGDSYKAEEGLHDDLVMTLVLFGWLTMQDYFKELTDLNIRNQLVLRDLGKTEEEYYPAGVFSSFEDSTDAPDGIVSLSQLEKWLNE